MTVVLSSTAINHNCNCMIKNKYDCLRSPCHFRFLWSCCEFMLVSAKGERVGTTPRILRLHFDSRVTIFLAVALSFADWCFKFLLRNPLPLVTAARGQQAQTDLSFVEPFELLRFGFVGIRIVPSLNRGSALALSTEYPFASVCLNLWCCVLSLIALSRVGDKIKIVTWKRFSSVTASVDEYKKDLEPLNAPQELATLNLRKWQKTFSSCLQEFRVEILMLVLGSIGNNLDRVFFEGVIDYIHFFGIHSSLDYAWNLSDLLITCGTVKFWWSIMQK
ncbi:unnamed protein product [Amoebophrya sp. A25]|nr:unnamed protein product [Amoebophrya sp. A25]|eukprot:GSA25T00019098001.1